MASILIIDDDESMRAALRAMVRRQGHDPVCAATLRLAVSVKVCSAARISTKPPVK